MILNCYFISTLLIIFKQTSLNVLKLQKTMTITAIESANIKYSLRSMLEKFTPLITDYFTQVSKINKESARKEHFVVLMTQLFGDDPENLKAIKRFASGAETTRRNIPLKTHIKTGSADTQYNNVIIEFEKDLRVKGAEAKFQLAEYLSSNFKTDGNYNFTLIATDCINWIIFKLWASPFLRDFPESR